MMRHIARRALAACLIFGPVAALGQSPTIDTSGAAPPGGSQSMLGSPPGGQSGSFDSSPGAQQGTLGGRPGASTSRAPTSITTPTGTNAATMGRGAIAAPPSLANADIPIYGPLDFPNVTDDPGPADGITLDAAIERLVRENLYLRAVSFELPMGEADVLTASLRANPVFYADTQLIPYGAYSRNRPGGQTQYDVNISYPLDVSFKRKARIVSSSRAKQVLEQQYRDAVRLQIDNLYTVYVDVLAARATLRFTTASVTGLEKFYAVVESKVNEGADIKTEAAQGEDPEGAGLPEPSRRRGLAPQGQEEPGEPPERPARPGGRSGPEQPSAGPRPRSAPGGDPAGDRHAGPARPDREPAGAASRRGRRQARQGQPLPGRVRAVPALHVPGQHAQRPQERDVLGPGRDGADPDLQPEPGPDHAESPERRADADPARTGDEAGHHRRPAGRTRIPSHPRSGRERSTGT